MQERLRKSFIYIAITTIALWFDRAWANSRIINCLQTGWYGEELSESSVLTRIGRRLRHILSVFFEKTSLKRLLKGSILKRVYIWCILTSTLAPILPTMAVIALAAISTGSLLLKIGCDRDLKLSYAPVNKFILLFAFIYLVATLTSVTPAGSFKGGLVVVFFVLFSLVFENAITTRREMDVALYLMIASGTLISAYGCYQYVFGTIGAEAWIDSDMFSNISNRVYSTLQNPNVLSEYLLLIIPVTFAMALSERNKPLRLLLLGCGLGMGLCMLLTFSRGGYLGLLFAGAFFLILIDRRFLFLGLVLLAGAVLIMPDTIVTRFTSIGNMGDSSTSYRVSIWFGTLAMLKDYWLCGIGPGTAAFQKIYPVYSYAEAAAQHAHNLFLQITCDCGVSGIAVFLLIVFTFFKSISSSIIREPMGRSKLLQIGVFSAVLGFLVQGMTDNSFYNYRVLLMFWIFITLGSLVSKRSSMPEAKHDKDT